MRKNSNSIIITRDLNHLYQKMMSSRAQNKWRICKSWIIWLMFVIFKKYWTLKNRLFSSTYGIFIKIWPFTRLQRKFQQISNCVTWTGFSDFSGIITVEINEVICFLQTHTHSYTHTHTHTQRERPENQNTLFEIIHGYTYIWICMGKAQLMSVIPM